MKAYSKPEIAFEDFSMSTNIASGCEISANWSAAQCVITVGGGAMSYTIFTDENSNCAIKEANQDTYCYHVPENTNNVFAS